MPALGWERAYRSGDLVRLDRAGLVFQGRADDQVKLGGRRIELGEIDAALQRAARRRGGGGRRPHSPAAGNQVLVGYVALTPDSELRPRPRPAAPRGLPAALVPLLAVVDELPTRTSGKVDRDALPWPLPGRDVTIRPAVHFSGTAELAGRAVDRRARRRRPATWTTTSSTTAAAAWRPPSSCRALRTRFPEVTVADVYDHPRLGSLAATARRVRAGGRRPTTAASRRHPRPARLVQTAVARPAVHPRRAALAALARGREQRARLGRRGVAGRRPSPGGGCSAGWLLLVSPFGRMALSAARRPAAAAGVRPGDYPRGGSVHLRLWLAEPLAHAIGAVEPVGRAVDQLLRAGARRVDRRPTSTCTRCRRSPACSASATARRSSPRSTSPATGSTATSLHIGRVQRRAPARPSASRSTLLPGARIGQDAEIAPGSAVFGRVPSGQRWARLAGAAASASPGTVGPVGDRRAHRRWVPVFGLTAAVLGALPLLAAAAGLAVVGIAVHDAADAGRRGAGGRARRAAGRGRWRCCCSRLLTLGIVRLLGIGLRAGFHPVRSRIGWQVWATERLLDAARTLLFPLYASLLTPVWLRALGREGRAATSRPRRCCCCRR